METPDSKAGRETERVMMALASNFNPDALMKNVNTATYNRLWSIVLEHFTQQEKTSLLNSAGFKKK